jgi:hypothetical protein
MNLKRASSTFVGEDREVFAVNITDDEALGLGFSIAMTYAYLPIISDLRLENTIALCLFRLKRPRKARDFTWTRSLVNKQ